MTSWAKGTDVQHPRGTAALASQSDPRRVHLCPGVACGLGHVPGRGCPAWAGRLPPDQRPPLVQRKVYLVEAVLMSFLLGAVEAGTPTQAQSVVRQVLDLLWLFMEVRLRPDCPAPLRRGLLGTAVLEPAPSPVAMQPGISPLGLRGTRLPQAVDDVPAAAVPVLAHRPRPEPAGGHSCCCPKPPGPHPPTLSTPSPQIHYLRLTIAILRHEKSRKFLLSNVLYPPLTTRQARHVVPSGVSRGQGGPCAPAQESPGRLRKTRAT